jgi:DNA-binding transcriptional regulator/RsmH inhibitor MraZ
MVEFCGQESCTVDGNGRVKLSARFLADFQAHGTEVVLHCLPEGCLGVYPSPMWLQMRRPEAGATVAAAQSVVIRRQARRFGAMTCVETITNQGRITVPLPFRPLLGLLPGTACMVVGCEIGVEVWGAAAWAQEFEVLREHERLKAAAEMSADLRGVEPQVSCGTSAR